MFKVIKKTLTIKDDPKMSLQCLVHNSLTSGFVAFQIKYFLTNSILKARLFCYGSKENNQN